MPLQSRSNLIRNMHKQYIRTGYVWEQYDDDIGTGKVRTLSHISVLAKELKSGAPPLLTIWFSFDVVEGM